MNWSNKWGDVKCNVAEMCIQPNICNKVNECVWGVEDTGSGPLPNDGSVTWGNKKIKGEWTTKPTIGIDWGTGDSTTGKIIFLDGNKRRSIDVMIVGDLALDYDEDGWNIYHVPTLACFSKAVPGYEPDIFIEQIEPISGTFQGSNIKWISKEEAEEKWPSNNKEQLSFDYSREALLAWMKKVQENYQTSWQMLRLLTPDNHADKGRRAKEIILEWCLSVKVEE